MTNHSNPLIREHLLPGPKRFAKFAEDYSTLCKEHGLHYFRTLNLRALNDCLPPIQPRAKVKPMASCCEATIQRVKEDRTELPTANEISSAAKILMDSKALPPCCHGALATYAWNEECDFSSARIRERDLKPCCRKALKAYRWWQELEELGEIKFTVPTHGHSEHQADKSSLAGEQILTPEQFKERADILSKVFGARRALRYQLVVALFRHYQRPLGADVAKFIGRVSEIYRSWGGTTRIRGQKDLHKPFAKVLAHLRNKLPVDRKCASLEAFLDCARETIDALYGLDLPEHRQRLAAPSKRAMKPKKPKERTGEIELKVSLPAKMRSHPVWKKRPPTLLERKHGEHVVVPAKWSCDPDSKKWHWKPVAKFWSHRIDEGTAKIIAKSPNPLGYRNKRKSPLTHFE